MLQNLKSNRGGFTLIEIMIVVAIIALLASVAVPNAVRARKRAQATALLEELRVLDAAKEQYAAENNVIGTATPTFTQLQPFFKKDSGLYTRGSFTDSMGNAITINTFDTAPQLNSSSVANFNDVVPAGFFAPFEP
jgi:prepilin-type N-terminal cleavage/methylation domain-containing protein